MISKRTFLASRAFLIVLLVVLSLSFVVFSVSAQDSPEDVARALIAAEDSNDVDAAVAQFADDAVVTLPTGTFDTSEAIRGWQQELADGHFRIEAAHMQSDGNTVTWDGTVSLDTFRNLGIASMAGIWTLDIEDGKVKTFDFTFTPEAFTELTTGITAAILIAAEAAHDVDAAMATFADDAVVTLADGSVYDTPEGIRGWQQALADGHFRIEPEGLYVDGNTVSWMGEISLDAFRQMGIPVLGGIWKLVVEDGKVKTFDFSFTPEALAVLTATPEASS
jgi:hypothetical protein